MKTKFFNLIILDESGSMECMHKQTIDGCNETINTIISAQKKYEESQEHFISIYAFQSDSEKESRYLIKNTPASDVKHITEKDYQPWGCTPLYDAIGSTLTDLYTKVKREVTAVGSVTIITDGAENSSVHYNGSQVAEMIDQLKQKGWNFNFIGANIDVKAVASHLNIDNYLAFEQNEDEVNQMFRKERNSRMGYYSRVECCMSGFSLSEEMKKEDREELLRTASKDYFSDDTPRRITPERIRVLKDNEIFVFGSNLEGRHGGGAAHAAWKYFGAVWGQGKGLQGQSYAIPTMQGGVETIRPFVEEFIDFAESRPNLKFLVTRIGCGIAGFSDDEIAPLFYRAKKIPNIYLPKTFW